MPTSREDLAWGGGGGVESIHSLFCPRSQNILFMCYSISVGVYEIIQISIPDNNKIMTKKRTGGGGGGVLPKFCQDSAWILPKFLPKFAWIIALEFFFWGGGGGEGVQLCTLISACMKSPCVINSDTAAGQIIVAGVRSF